MEKIEVIPKKFPCGCRVIRVPRPPLVLRATGIFEPSPYTPISHVDLEVLGCIVAGALVKVAVDVVERKVYIEADDLVRTIAEQAFVKAGGQA